MADTPPRPRGRWLRRLLLYPSLGLAGTLAALLVFVATTRYPPQVAAQEGALALTGATVLTGTDLEPVTDATVLIRDGSIEAIGPREEVAIPDGAVTHDLSGTTLLPGLIDLHVHLGTPELDAGLEHGWRTLPRAVIDTIRHAPGARRAMLEHGITAFRSLGDDRDWVLEVRRMVADGELEGPRVFAAGPVITSRGGHPVQTIHGGTVTDGVVEVPESPSQARATVEALAEDGVDAIKVIHDRGSPQRPLEPLDPEILAAIVETADAAGLPVVAHWGTFEDLEEVLAAGLDGGLEHLERRGASGDGWPPGSIETLAERRIPFGPTLAVSRAGIRGHDQEILRWQQESLMELHAAGVPIVASSDAPMNGLRFGDAIHTELERLVEFGLSPTEAIQAATTTAADALRTDEIGVIEAGRAADLLAVDGDPLSDITALREVAAVWRDGRLVVDREEG